MKSKKIRIITGIVLSTALMFSLFSVKTADAASSPKPAKTSVSVAMGASVKVSIKANGWTVKSVKVSAKTEYFKAKASKKALTVTGEEEGSGKIALKIKAKKAKKTKTFKKTVKVKVSASKEGKLIYEKYSTPDRINQPRAASIEAFSGDVKEENVGSDTKKTVAKYSDKLEIKAYNIDGIHVYDLNLNDGVKKPLLIYLPSGDAPKEEPFWEEGGKSRACVIAEAGFRVVSVDQPGCGRSGVGPIDALAGFAETVSYVDKLVEYYNTVSDVDATRFAIQGMSKGGNVAFAYVAHGKYKPGAIITEAGIPDYNDLTDGPKYDCFVAGHGGVKNVMSKKQIDKLADLISPIKYIDKFKDVYVFAANYEEDPVYSPTSCKTLGEEMAKIGGNASINTISGEGHVGIPIIEEKTVDVLKEHLGA